jgi:hypothetical protein
MSSVKWQTEDGSHGVVLDDKDKTGWKHGLAWIKHQTHNILDTTPIPQESSEKISLRNRFAMAILSGPLAYGCNGGDAVTTAKNVREYADALVKEMGQ